jgi:serine protease Do
MLALVAAAVAIPPPAYAGRLDGADGTLALTNTTMQTLVRQVGRSVVQIVVSGYQPAADDDGAGATLVRVRSIGSGAVIAHDGFIVTNAHVVAGASRIDVLLPDAELDETPLATHGGRTMSARLIGIAPEIDLALVKIDADLPPLTIADPASLKQGELVLAFGSPDGLRNSVSMGLVSAVGRQLEPSSPIAYVQTDAAINPGNSGGPLVNVDGDLVGLNTFIRTQSGGSEGLGFALPGAVLSLAVPQLREFGHLHRAALGLSLQNITPLIREGLQLPYDSGLIIADVAAGGPAAVAGLQSGDVVTMMDNREVQQLSFADLYGYLYGLHDGQEVTVSVVRGGQTRTARLRAMTPAHTCERPSLLEIEDAVVEPLGIVGQNVEEPGRVGVAVTARLSGTSAVDSSVASGDVIRAVNGEPITSVVALRDAMARIERGHAVVLQVERGGTLSYVAFER